MTVRSRKRPNPRKHVLAAFLKGVSGGLRRNSDRARRLVVKLRAIVLRFQRPSATKRMPGELPAAATADPHADVAMNAPVTANGDAIRGAVREAGVAPHAVVPEAASLKYEPDPNVGFRLGRW